MELGWAEEKMRLPLQEQQEVKLLDADTSAIIDHIVDTTHTIERRAID